MSRVTTKGFWQGERVSLLPLLSPKGSSFFFIFLYLAVNNSPIFSVRVCLFDPACRLVFFVCSKVVKKRFNFLRLKHEETNTRPVFLSLSPSCSSAQLCVYTSKVNDRSTRGPFFLLTYASFFSLSNKLLKKKKKDFETLLYGGGWLCAAICQTSGKENTESSSQLPRVCAWPLRTPHLIPPSLENVQHCNQSCEERRLVGR